MDRPSPSLNSLWFDRHPISIATVVLLMSIIIGLLALSYSDPQDTYTEINLPKKSNSDQSMMPEIQSPLSPLKIPNQHQYNLVLSPVLNQSSLIVSNLNPSIQQVHSQDIKYSLDKLSTPTIQLHESVIPVSTSAKDLFGTHTFQLTLAQGENLRRINLEASSASLIESLPGFIITNQALYRIDLLEHAATLSELFRFPTLSSHHQAKYLDDRLLLTYAEPAPSACAHTYGSIGSLALKHSCSDLIAPPDQALKATHLFHLILINPLKDSLISNRHLLLASSNTRLHWLADRLIVEHQLPNQQLEFIDQWLTATSQANPSSTSLIDTKSSSPNPADLLSIVESMISTASDSANVLTLAEVSEKDFVHHLNQDQLKWSSSLILSISTKDAEPTKFTRLPGHISELSLSESADLKLVSVQTIPFIQPTERNYLFSFTINNQQLELLSSELALNQTL